MGICSSKERVETEPDKFFNREKWKDEKLREEAMKNANVEKRRKGKNVPLASHITEARLTSVPALLPVAPPSRSYDEEAIELMRHQLANDSEAFVLNNILLSVQFFENFER